MLVDPSPLLRETLLTQSDLVVIEEPGLPEAFGASDLSLLHRQVEIVLTLPSYRHPARFHEDLIAVLVVAIS
jgi:hypothetical protein